MSQYSSKEQVKERSKSKLREGPAMQESTEKTTAWKKKKNQRLAGKVVSLGRSGGTFCSIGGPSERGGLEPVRETGSTDEKPAGGQHLRSSHQPGLCGAAAM